MSKRSKQRLRLLEGLKERKERETKRQAEIEALSDTVICEVCKKPVKFILTDDHFASAGTENGCSEDGKGLKLSEYREQFPTAEVLSPRFKEMQRRRLEDQAIRGRIKAMGKVSHPKVGTPPTERVPTLLEIHQFLKEWIPKTSEDLRTIARDVAVLRSGLNEKGVWTHDDHKAQTEKLIEKAKEYMEKQEDQPVQVPTPLQVVDAPPDAEVPAPAEVQSEAPPAPEPAQAEVPVAPEPAPTPEVANG